MNNVILMIALSLFNPILSQIKCTGEPGPGFDPNECIRRSSTNDCCWIQYKDIDKRKRHICYEINEEGAKDYVLDRLIGKYYTNIDIQCYSNYIIVAGAFYFFAFIIFY